MKITKKGILLVVLFLTIGFAAITTTLTITGTATIKANNEDFEKNVIFCCWYYHTTEFYFVGYSRLTGWLHLGFSYVTGLYQKKNIFLKKENWKDSMMGNGRILRTFLLTFRRKKRNIFIAVSSMP